jgi:beta-aspartyl-peptidase (threonine type)
MSRLKLLAIPCLLLPLAAAQAAAPPAPPPPPPGVVLVIHAGAGVIEPAKMTPDKEASYRAGLAAALDAGYSILERGGSSLDAVTAAVRMMEDDPQFNAGRGAVLNHHGQAELDAAIMDGRGPRAGAVAGVMHVKNPIELARLVMERSPHVLLIGQGAEEFALEQGLVLVPNEYFKTRVRLQQLQEEQQGQRGGGDGQSKGTVGAVALDREGNLAAGTSTGGISNKHVGRVGDSPIIGAGCFTDNAVGSAGSTGRGEANILVAGGHLAVEMMRKGAHPKDACLEVLRRIAQTTKAKRLLDPKGRPAFGIKFYAVNKAGAYGSASMWGGAGGKPATFAVADAKGARVEECAFLFEGQPAV